MEMGRTGSTATASDDKPSKPKLEPEIVRTMRDREVVRLTCF